MEISYIYFRIQWVIKISKLFKSALLPKYSISPSTTFLKWKHYILLKKCEQWLIDLLNFQTMEFPANLSNKAGFLCSIHSFFYFMWMVYAWVAINDQIFQILSLSLLLCLFKDSSDCHHVHCCLVFSADQTISMKQNSWQSTHHPLLIASFHHVFITAFLEKRYDVSTSSFYFNLFAHLN